MRIQLISVLKCDNDPKFVRDSNSSLKLLAFQPSNVRELESIKYAFASNQYHIRNIADHMQVPIPRDQINIGPALFIYCIFIYYGYYNSPLSSQPCVLKSNSLDVKVQRRSAAQALKRPSNAHSGNKQKSHIKLISYII